MAVGDTPCPRAKEKTKQDGKRGELPFRIKPHSRQRCSEDSDNPCAHKDPGTSQRLRQDCICVSPIEVQVGGALQHGQGLWVQQNWVWHKPSWRRSPKGILKINQLLNKDNQATDGKMMDLVSHH